MSTLEVVEDFGPYKLVARNTGGKSVGVLWKIELGQPAVKLIQVEAGSPEEAKEMIEASFYQSMLVRAQADAEVPEVEKLVRAWMCIWPQLNANQQRMIVAQYRAPGMRMSTTELAHTVGWQEHSGVNLWYGYAGFMMFAHCPRELPKDEKTGKRIFSFALSTGWWESSPEGKRWIWEMRSEVAKALALSGLVA